MYAPTSTDDPDSSWHTTSVQPTAIGPDLSPLADLVSVESVLSVIILLVFIWWAVFTIVVIYHWIRYARDSWMAVPAIVLHLVVSTWIFVFATGGLH